MLAVIDRDTKGWTPRYIGAGERNSLLTRLPNIRITQSQACNNAISRTVPNGAQLLWSRGFCLCVESNLIVPLRFIFLGFISRGVCAGETNALFDDCLIMDCTLH